MCAGQCIAVVYLLTACKPSNWTAPLNPCRSSALLRTSLILPVQAYARHPYANTGFGAAFLVGIAAWWFVSSSKDGKQAPSPQPASSKGGP